MIDEYAKKANQLFTLPDICLQLNQLIHQPNSSAKEIARLVSVDPAITVRILKIANSALYGFSANIGTVAQAIVVIGTEELYNIALATSAAATFGGVDGKFIDLKEYWYLSVLGGVLAKEINRRKALGCGDSLFVAGLLHNIGLLIVLETNPEQAAKAVEPIDINQHSWEREQQVLGFTFADLGAALLRLWQVPQLLVDTVAYQHKPEQAGDSRMAASVVHAATRLASYLVSSKHVRLDPSLLSAVGDGALQRLAMTEEDLEEVVAVGLETAPEVARIFRD